MVLKVVWVFFFFFYLIGQKTLWEKNKILVASILSFSISISFLSKDKVYHYRQINLRSGNSFYRAEPCSSVGSTQDLRTGGCCFDPLLGQYSFCGLMDRHWNTSHSALTAFHFFNNGFVGKQLVAWEEYCAKYG